MKTTVIKLGGAIMQNPSLMKTTIQDIAHLQNSHFFPIIVHGGGPVISNMCQRLGLETQFINGLRITDNNTLEIVQMVLAGKINKDIVMLLNQEHVKAVGLSGQDSQLLVAKKYIHPSGIDLGYVGEVHQTNPEILHILMERGYVPVIAPIATSLENQNYNINADEAASAIAMALNADHLIFLTDVAGVFSDIHDPSTKLDLIVENEVDGMISTGKLKGGMIPKVQGALKALRGGVNQVHIIDGGIPHSLLYQVEGTRNVGTTICK